MVKFLATRDGRMFLAFGLTRENITRLMQDEPITIDTKDLGLAPGTLCIFVGETEATIYDTLKEQGVVGPQTIVHGTATRHG
jgi:hypothetical protein